MIKSIFLNQRTNKAPQQKEHLTYDQSRHIGILYNLDEFDAKIISGLMDEIKNDSKKVSILGFVNSPNEKSNSDESLFSKKDISTTGGIKKDSVGHFTHEEFDFLISLDTSENINYKFVLASCSASCKVGFETESYRDLLLMTMNLSEDKTTSVKQLITYLKKI